MSIGMTVTELAARANITANYLGDLESGRRNRNPSIVTVLAIAAALSADPGELLGSRTQRINPIGVEAAHLLQALPQSIQEAVLYLLRTLVLRQL